MDYKNLKSTRILGAMSRLITCLDCYSHHDFVINATLYKEQYLSGKRSLSSLKKCVRLLVLVSISELSYDMRQCYLRENIESALGYAEHIKVLTNLL